MKLRSIKQEEKEYVKIYYKQILKLTNCLYIKAVNTYFIIVFKVGLHPYIQLSTIGMKHETLIKHKKVVICEESGPKGYNSFFINSYK